jgi:hypothetical protein
VSCRPCRQEPVEGGSDQDANGGTRRGGCNFARYAPDDRFGSKCIFVGRESREVAVVIDEPDSSIERVVDAVERWFRHGQVATVEMSLGKRSYNLAQWLPAEARR